MSHFFTAAVLIATVAAGVQLATPFLMAALGETMGQRSGVVNLGVDGIMLLGAFGAYYVAAKTGNLVLAAAVGLGIGVVMGLVTAVMSVTLKAEQGISGIGVFLFGLGLTNVLLLRVFPSPVTLPALPAVPIPLLHRIPYLGPMFFTQNWLVYLAFLLVPVLTFVLNRTTYGMKIRAVGENPAAADTVGVSVTRIRYSTVIIGCALAGPGRRDTAPADRDLPGGPHQQRGLHCGRPGLLRRLAAARRDGRVAAVRHGRRRGRDVEDPGHHSDFRVRHRGDGTRRPDRGRPAIGGTPVPAARRLGQALREGGVNLGRACHQPTEIGRPAANPLNPFLLHPP